MRSIIQDPIKMFLSIIAFIVFALFVVIGISSCESRSERHFREAQESKQAFEVVEHNAKAIIIETLHLGDLMDGVHKVTIDSSEYIIFADNQGVAIIKHK